MSKLLKLFFFGLLLSSLQVAKAQTVAAASCNTSDVQTAINAASAGQTVSIPAGTCTWTSGVSVSKNITIAGAGAGRIVAYSASTLTIGTGSKSLTIAGATAIANTTPPATAALSTLGFVSGQTLRISELGFRANFLQGTVTSWTPGTGALVMNITSSGGTCGTTDPNMVSNCKRWLISTIPSTVITHNSSSTLFNLTESTAGDLTITGIKVAAGTGSATIVYFTRASNGKAIILHDDWFEIGSALEGAGGTIAIDGNTDRGLIYNTSFDNSPFAVIEDVRIKDDSNTAMPTSWTTVSTFGANDTASTAFCSTCLAGQNNFYLENDDFHAGENLIDWDSNARSVVRYSLFNNAGTGSHGADTSTVGNRHFEIYNNVGVFNGYNDGTTANMNWWLFHRGGTFAMHDNVFPAITSTDYGSKNDVTIAVENLDRNSSQHPCWGEGGTGGQYYYAPRQSGFGRVTGSGTTQGPQASCPSSTNCSGNYFNGATDGFTYVGDSEPIYIWNNRRTTGGSTVALIEGNSVPAGECTAPDSQANYVVSGRDYFDTTGTAKPSYTPYTYPHPLTQSSAQTIPTSPANLKGQAVSN